LGFEENKKMAKIIGIDLGTTYSAVSIWDSKQAKTMIIPNLRGQRTTPSVVSVNEAGEVIVGEDAKQNFAIDPQNTISEIKREMGKDFIVTMGGREYNPQTISAFIIRYLKQCAEQCLGEPIYDVVITVPAHFTEVQKSATRDAGHIAGLNVRRLINEPTAAAIAYGVDQVEGDEEKVYAVYDLGGGTFDVSIIEVTSDDVTVIGTGGIPRLGGLDMDEVVTKWALREIKQKYGVDLSKDETARRRLRTEAEDVKKALVVSETATLNAPFLSVVDNKPLNVSLQITRDSFDMLISSLIRRSLICLEESMTSATEHNQRDWEDLDGVLLVGGPTRIKKIRDMLIEKLHEHCPEKEVAILSDHNPDEVVAMGAAIVAASMKPIGRPPEELEELEPDEINALTGEAKDDDKVPMVDIYDVTSHSLGIAVEGHKFHKIIEKETIIPVSVKHGPFSNIADYTTQLLVQIYQGEEEFLAANTLIGEVRIDGLEPKPKGEQAFEVEFAMDINGTLSTNCLDMRTGKTYSGSFTFDGVTRMSADEIKAKRAAVASQMASTGSSMPEQPVQKTMPPEQIPQPINIPELTIDQVPEDWQVFWQKGQELLSSLDGAKKTTLANDMVEFANAVINGNASDIEEKAFQLHDTILDVQI
jgi:molecular chaperone DnaK